MYDIRQISNRFLACVLKTVPSEAPDIEMDAEDGESATFMADRVSNNDYAQVTTAKEVLYYAGRATAKADGVSRSFDFCGVYRGYVRIERCIVEPVSASPPTADCLTDSWITSAPVFPNPNPAPNPD